MIHSPVTRPAFVHVHRLALRALGVPVTIHPLARREWPELPGRLPAGAWLLTIDGELQVQFDGQVVPRATPLPWSRPSAAGMPTSGRP